MTQTENDQPTEATQVSSVTFEPPSSYTLELRPQADTVLPEHQPGWWELFFATFGTINPITTGQAVRKAIRTFFQAGIPVAVAAGTGAFTGDVALAAALAGGAAVIAFVQNALGK